MFEARYSGIFDRNHRYSTRSYYDLVPFQARLTVTKNSLKVCGPNIWNSIPLEIRNSPTLSIFKNRYKKHLLSLYNGNRTDWYVNHISFTFPTMWALKWDNLPPHSYLGCVWLMIINFIAMWGFKLGKILKVSYNIVLYIIGLKIPLPCFTVI